MLSCSCTLVVVLPGEFGLNCLLIKVIVKSDFFFFLFWDWKDGSVLEMSTALPEDLGLI